MNLTNRVCKIAYMEVNRNYSQAIARIGKRYQLEDALLKKI
jgi:hypothetical protein